MSSASGTPRKVFKHLVSQISKDSSVQNLRSAITKSGHCQIYRTLKCNMDFEPYLTLLDKKYATPLIYANSVQGITNSRLAVIKNTPSNERFCLQCPNRKLGDE